MPEFRLDRLRRRKAWQPAHAIDARRSALDAQVVVVAPFAAVVIAFTIVRLR
jgi:hypothetical protein